MYTKKRLIAVSLALYAVSLCLPAVGGQNGLIVMTMTMAYGWLAVATGLLPALAAYANVFYWWAALQAARGKKPITASWFCMFFAAFTLLVPLLPMMRGYEFAVIGWGAFLWLASLWLMRLVVVLADQDAPEVWRRTLKKWAGVSVAITLALFAFGRWQYAAANAQQREQYFPAGTVFALMWPVDVPYIEPPQSLPVPGNGTAEWLGGLEFSEDNSPILFSGSLKEYNPPKRFIYQGYLIQEYFHEDGILSIVPAEKAADYRYGFRTAKPGEKGQFVQFIQSTGGRTLWQAPVEYTKREIYPDYSRPIQRLWQPQPHTEIAAAFNAAPEQSFSETCPAEPYSAPFKLHEPLQINGKIYSDTRRSSIGRSRILCNEQYILWLDAPEYQSHLQRTELSAVLIRRSDMQPVETYSAWDESPALRQAAQEPHTWLAGIRRMETRRQKEFSLRNSELVVYGAQGEWVLH